MPFLHCTHTILHHVLWETGKQYHCTYSIVATSHHFLMYPLYIHVPSLQYRIHQCLLQSFPISVHFPVMHNNYTDQVNTSCGPFPARYMVQLAKERSNSLYWVDQQYACINNLISYTCTFVHVHIHTLCIIYACILTTAWGYSAHDLEHGQPGTHVVPTTTCMYIHTANWDFSSTTHGRVLLCVYCNSYCAMLVSQIAKS